MEKIPSQSQSRVYQLTITSEAESQLRSFPVRQQRLIEAAIRARLLHLPTVISRAVKKLRPNPLVQFELRAGDLRVLYNVEGNEVVVLVVGRKAGNTLLVKGKAFHGHQDNSIEPPEGEPESDAG
jgi:mRNA-degrading endonuclease RelE of RelBE toxin-antitoxin system